MSRIGRIIERFKKADLKSGGQPQTNASDLPLDHQLTFKRDKESWSFKDGQICLDDEDIESLIDKQKDDVQFQSAVSDAVSEYKELVYERGGPSCDKFTARADMVLDKVLCNMKRIYDEKMGGVRLKWGEGSCLLNNLNIRAIIALYHIRPTPKAHIFLRGLKSKLALILANRNASPHYERVNTFVKSLYNEVDDALREAPIDVRYLSNSNSNRAV